MYHGTMVGLGLWAWITVGLRLASCVVDTWEAVLLALRLLQPGRALGRSGCCAGCGDALALAGGCGLGSTLDAGRDS